MSSRRDLKKLVNNSMDILYTDCVFYAAFSKNANVEKAETIIAEIAKVQDELLSRISHNEGKGLKSRTKAYYKKLRVDLKSQIDKFGKDIQSLD